MCSMEHESWSLWLDMFKLIFCWLFGHQYYVVQEFSPAIRRIHCPRCGADMGMHDKLKVVIPWDGELEQLHSVTEDGQPQRIIKPWR